MAELMAPDPDVFVPPAVRRAAAEAERLAAEATAEARAAAGLPAQEAAADEGGEGQQAGSDLLSGEAAPPPPKYTTVVEEARQPAPAQTQEPVRDAAYWEQRARTLQGKYDSEVPAATARLRATEAQLSQAQSRLADLNMQLSRPAPSQPSSTQSSRRAAQLEIPPEDVETYGQDFIEKVRSWVPAADVSEVERLRQQVENIETRTRGQQQEAAQHAVMMFMDARMPGWQEINTDPTFIAWTQQPDPFSGRVRLELLREAYTNGDTARTLAFFEAFTAEHTAAQPSGRPPAHTPSASYGNGAGSVPLIELTAPGRGRPPMPPGAPDRPSFTRRQVSAFYNDVTRGKYRYNEAEKNRIEGLIHQAIAEGRID